ncbi:hypothetical protein AALO_G00025710 [Alosa alosa]|uniref:Uncharacterized protein n=1 Tax=Alosa alosa TaxID=278164 RepID=A0AAV6HEP5_9TELE|nr:hypothetical protein AALO_G00025710 [Alosa alosa]
MGWVVIAKTSTVPGFDSPALDLLGDAVDLTTAEKRWQQILRSKSRIRRDAVGEAMVVIAPTEFAAGCEVRLKSSATTTHDLGATDLPARLD